MNSAYQQHGFTYPSTSDVVFKDCTARAGGSGIMLEPSPEEVDAAITELIVIAARLG